jgi:NAD(P)H-dependent FMN reductase
MQELNIAIIVGTKRRERESIKIAELIYKVAESFVGFRPRMIDPLEFDFSKNDLEPSLSNNNFKKIIEEADALLIVVPEYNHSYPAILKRVLDSEYSAYFHKPVALAGVSSGPWGGVRAIESILPVLRTLGLIISRQDLNFPNAQDLFDQQGNLIIDDKYLKRIEKSLEELLWLAKTLKWGRENLS